MFFVLAILCLLIFYACKFFSGKIDQVDFGNSSEKQQIFNQNDNKEKKLKMSEYDCSKGSREGYVKIEGNIIRPDWLDSQKTLFVIADWEIYPANQNNSFCVFAPPKTDIISVVVGDEWEKPILLFALVANKDKNITIDAQSTAVALVFKGTRSDWQQNSLEDSIAAFNYIQQDENIKKLAEDISRDSNFRAEKITSDDSDVAKTYQQTITSLESKKRNKYDSEEKLRIIVTLNPIDFYRDSQDSYFINGKIETIEIVSRNSELQDNLGNIKEGSQMGVFFDNSKIPVPEEKLVRGYNERRVRIKAVFEVANDRFVAEELSIL